MAPPRDDDSDVDRQMLLTALTTEHFTLQGARATTVSESTARAALFVGALSSALVALGFTSQVATDDTVLEVFALVSLPTLYLLGTFTFVRLVASSIEDIGYGRAINRIRAYYLEVAGDKRHYFALGAHDDPMGVLANMGVTQPSRWQLYFTLATMIAMLNAVVGGSAVAFLAFTVGMGTAAAAGAGAVPALMSLAVSVRWQRNQHDDARGNGEVLFPSPSEQK